MSRYLFFVVTILTFTLSCSDDDQNSNATDTIYVMPIDAIESADDKADRLFKEGDYSCYFHYKEMYDGKVPLSIPRDALLYRLGVCSFHNKDEEHFKIKRQLPTYDNFSFAQDYFSKITKPENPDVPHEDSTVTFNDHFKKAQFYLGLLYFYDGTGTISSDHNKALEYFLEAKLDNDEQSRTIKSQVKQLKEDKVENDDPYVLYGHPSKYIAQIYHMNRSVPADDKLFLSYMTSAADDELMPDAEASYLLGQFFYSEKNDKRKAKEYMETSRKLGLNDAKRFWDDNHLYLVKSPKSKGSNSKSIEEEQEAERVSKEIDSKLAAVKENLTSFKELLATLKADPDAVKEDPEKRKAIMETFKSTMKSFKSQTKSFKSFLETFKENIKTFKENWKDNKPVQETE